MSTRSLMDGALFPSWRMCQAYGHGERVFDLGFHPLNSDIIASASEDTSVRLWKREEGAGVYKQARCYFGHQGEVLRVSWSRTGLLLVSGSADKTVRLWGADMDDPGYTGRQLAVLDGHPEEVYYADMVDPAHPAPARSHAGSGLGLAAAAAAAAADGRPNGHHPQNGHGEGSGRCSGGDPQPELSAAMEEALLGYESHVLVASSESLFVWELAGGSLVQQANAPGTSGSTIKPDAMMRGARPAYIFSCCRQPGGSLIATACSDGAVRLWSLRPAGVLEYVGARSLSDDSMATAAAFSADGNRLCVTMRNGEVAMLDVRTMEEMQERLQVSASPVACVALTLPPRPASEGGPSEPPGCGSEAVLVPCQDGNTYAFSMPQGNGQSQPLGTISIPGNDEVPMLAIALSREGDAVAFAGEPQLLSRLPPVPPAASQSGTCLASGAGSHGLAAPLRRRGATRKVVAGGAAPDPLALFAMDNGEEGLAGTSPEAAAQDARSQPSGVAQRQPSGSGGGGVSGEMAGMSLGAGHGGRADGGAGGQGADASAADRHAAAGHDNPGEDMERVRAGIYVYRL